MGSAHKCSLSVDKLTVVIIEETKQRRNLPQSQLDAITSQIWKDYISKRGGQWRIIDKDAVLDKESEWVKDSMRIHRDSIPWLIIADEERCKSQKNVCVCVLGYP